MPGTIVRYGNIGRDALSLTQAFIVDKKECVAPDDRASQRRAKLVAFETRLAERIEIISGVERRVAEELKERPVQAVGSRLGHKFDIGSAIAAVLGTERIQ